jgi:hypothetical protein
MQKCTNMPWHKPICLTKTKKELPVSAETRVNPYVQLLVIG